MPAPGPLTRIGRALVVLGLAVGGVVVILDGQSQRAGSQSTWARAGFGVLIVATVILATGATAWAVAARRHPIRSQRVAVALIDMVLVAVAVQLTWRARRSILVPVPVAVLVADLAMMAVVAGAALVERGTVVLPPGRAATEVVAR